MKVYVDIVFILNFIIDFLLLLSVSYILKRNVSIKRIVFGALTGGISIFLLFLNLNNIELFIYKVVISIIMILTTFSYKNFKYFINNFIYLYLCSVVLGGALYLIKDEISLKNKGLIFINSNLKLNLLIVIVLIPIILFFYIKQLKKLKNNYNNYYSVELFYNNKRLIFNAFLDTGNKLKDQYKKRPIILVNTDKLNFSYENCILVPYTTVNGEGVIKCLKVDKIIIDKNIVINKPLVGLVKEKFGIEGINMILNNETI